MVNLTIYVPKDVGREFPNVSREDWQLLFSRFVKAKLEEIREIDDIVSGSKATEEQVKELSDKARSRIAKRFLVE
jgi:hypothetical protein